MADFYLDAQSMVRNMLKPSNQGWLGQGTVKLIRTTEDTPDPAKPWEPVDPQVTTQTLRAAVRGIDAKMVGTELNGTVLQAGDRIVISDVPAIEYQPGDSLEIDGVAVQVLGVQQIPAAGVRSAVKWFVR